MPNVRFSKCVVHSKQAPGCKQKSPRCGKKKIAQGIDKINAVKFNRRTVLIRFHDLDQTYI